MYTHIPKLIEFANQGLNRIFAFFYLGAFDHAQEWWSTSREGSTGRGTGAIVVLRGRSSGGAQRTVGRKVTAWTNKECEREG
jgi:L-aminopeptidase/D-esterase-like protein